MRHDLDIRIGDGLSDVLASHGPTFDLRIMWEHTIVTTDANIIKVRCYPTFKYLSSNFIFYRLF